MDTPSETGTKAIARWQFLIAEPSTPLQPDLTDVSTARLSVQVHPLWPVVKIVDGAGQQVGVLFGTAIEHRHQIVWKDTVRWTPPASMAPGNLRLAFEELLSDLSGSWVCVVDYHELRALYCDGATTISCLFNSERRIVAAAACQMFSDDELAKRQHHMGDLFYGADTFFVAGLTAYDDVSRLLINFRLNLATWLPERIWQAGGDRRPAWSATDYARFIGSRVKQTLAMLADDGSVAMTLTAGHESRILLSLSRALVDRVQFYTLEFPGSSMDVNCARRLSQRFGLRHQVLRRVKRSKAESAAWRKRTSQSVGGVNAAYASPAQHAKYVLNGNYGEFARAFNHEVTDGAFTHLTPLDILDRLRLPATDRNLRAITWWLATLWDHDTTTVLDAAQLELRYGCWASTQIVARDDASLWIAPLGDKAVISAMMCLPVAFRKAELMTTAIVAENWPELMDVPINRKTWLDHIQMLFATLTNIPIVVQKVKYEANGIWRRSKIKFGLTRGVEK